MILTSRNGIIQYFYLYKKNRFLSTSKTSCDYYKVLNLPRNCSTKEIKDSFIKLSKENHPDLNKNKDAHNKFLQINEAYEVLSKRESRRLYDLHFSTTRYPNERNTTPVYSPWQDPGFYRNGDYSRNRHYENRNGWYYGIRGVQKVSNFTVVLYCLSITFVVTGLQIFAIRKLLTVNKDKMMEKSNQANESLMQAREAASVNGNKGQIEILKLRLGQINPTDDKKK